MQIISFALTTHALLAGRKSVTRRDWPEKYAQQFKVGSLVQGYDRSPRNGGKCIAIIRTEDSRREPLSRLMEDPAYGREELVKEGNLWPSVKEFVALFGEPKHGDLVRLQFSLVEIKGQQTSLPFADPVEAVHAEFCRLTGQKLRLQLYKTHWHELLHVHGFTPADMALTASYLLRQVKAGKRQEGCLKLFNFANPIYFDADLALARKARPAQTRVAAPQPAISPAAAPVANVSLERLTAFKAQLRNGSANRL